MVRLAGKFVETKSLRKELTQPMAQNKSKGKTKTKPESKGVVKLLKGLVTRKPAASAARAGTKPVPASKSQAKAKPADTRKPARGKTTTNGKAPPAEPEKVKKKPPSITITRPEATRPPVVLPPPRPLEAPIGAPSILLPKGGLAINSLNPILRWMYVGGATRYEVEWSHDAHFGRGRSTTVVSTQTAITLDEPHVLKPGMNYRWRVRGGNDAGWGPWSPPESFKSPEKSS
jgi:hypothetical protein